ncbi:DUF779 domain-containing protein [Helicobacter didelphidarum]|uniref:DUF779 domain-containing protein n=1 Tax=Helicobacter didelphidarum TaxID=2040648 RepID=A0A3D8IJ92_9HELI|nr:DUF779 domain-containing protein [Helicobacter didelphidarum]RDU65397.1 DUF779 domain-containing protein [Helicobacter didelphidarum]
MDTLNITQEAKILIQQLKNEYHDFIIHISGGCCDGSAALCYEKGDFKIGENDILLGSVEQIEVFVHRSHYSYLEKSKLTLHALQGNGSEYSIEYGSGKYFVLESEICTTLSDDSK